jgi:hypothetical protein
MLLAACGGSMDPTPDAGGGCTIFQNWTLVTCTAPWCIQVLELGNASLGSNFLTIAFPDGVATGDPVPGCGFQCEINSYGQNPMQGVGTLTGGEPTTFASPQEVSWCDSLHNLAFTWQVTCDTLTITDLNGVATYARE